MDKKDKTQLGKILLKQKMVDSTQLDALLHDKQDPERLASKALKKGVIDETEALKALSEQHGVPAVNLEEVEIALENLKLIPRDIAIKHLVLPVSVTADTIRLAMANPTDRRVVDEIEFVTGKSVFPHVALHVQMTRIIEHCYKVFGEGHRVYRGAKYKKGSGIVEAASGKSPRQGREATGTVIADTIPPPEDDLSIDVDIPVDEFFDEEAPSAKREQSARDSVGELSSLPPKIDIEEASKEAPSGSKKVLVVDDEDDIRALICRVLVDKGYSVIEAGRGLEAIKKLQTDIPDMIILDAMLPEVHGFDICKKIKGSAKYGHIPVIMISAIYRGWRYAQDLKDSYGVDDFIEKPFKVNELIKKVEKFSRKSSPQLDNQKEEISKEAERLLTSGIEAYRGGEIDKAIELLKNGIAIDPLAYRLHYHLALLLGKKGLNYQAIRALENTLELSPEYFPALKNLAVLYQKSGFKFKAIETWERALGHCDDEETREGIKRQLVSLL